MSPSVADIALLTFRALHSTARNHWKKVFVIMGEAAIHGISLELIIHPGETISDVLEEHGMSQKELAELANVSEAFLSDVICGKKDIPMKLAAGLEYALDVPRSFWLNLQTNYNAELSGLHSDNETSAGEKAESRCSI